MDDIMVSVICIAYNQAEYIAETLDSILCQKVNFKYEVIVYDDASTDETASIIEQYACLYPDCITTKLQSENQMSRGVWIGKRLQEETARGKYITFCDGDDYWCDEGKLQKQVDYMETHDNCSLCFHNAEELDMATGNVKKTWRFERCVYRGAGDYPSEDMIRLKCVPTASMMFRKKHMPMPDLSSDKVIIGDMIRTLYLATKGYGHCMEETMSVYRVGVKNSITSRWKTDIESNNKRYQAAIETLHNFDKYTELRYQAVIKMMIEQYQNRILDFSEQDAEEISNRLADAESKKILNAGVHYLTSHNEENFYSQVINSDQEWYCKEIDGAERLSGKREIILYGAGKFGRYNYNILKLCRKKVTAFCDVCSKAETTEGVPVIPPSQLRSQYPNALIVISIKRGWEEVYENLLQMGVQKEDILYPQFGRLYAVCPAKLPAGASRPPRLVKRGELKLLETEREPGQRELSALAVPIDHRMRDIIRIPQYILNIAPDYQLYLRQETTRLCGTVLYAVPPLKGSETP